MQFTHIFTIVKVDVVKRGIHEKSRGIHAPAMNPSGTEG
jgi:hypothetical protein